MSVGLEQFLQQRFRRFGTANPERMNVPFWLEMIASGNGAYSARHKYDPDYKFDADEAVWCFQRFGMSRTELPDGRVVNIAGEHEDHYDPDFCIYNDVVVSRPDGDVDIFGYPRDVFPPTDFHSATLLGDSILIIGTLGYADKRKPGVTPVFRLDLSTYAIAPVVTSGENPGWLFKHAAELVANSGAVVVSGGEIVVEPRKKAIPNRERFRLDLRTYVWSRLPPTAVRSPKNQTLQRTGAAGKLLAVRTVPGRRPSR